jgi:hypothetical protein
MGLLGRVTDLNEGDALLGHRRVYTMALLREHFAASGLEVVHFAGVTLKTLSNAQLAELPRGYVDACIAMADEVGALACQIAVVATRPAL